MSDKSGVSSGALSLPSGGGSLEGAGGKFQARQQTGAGEYSLSLQVPSGRRGLTPQLALTYSTGNGNSEFGHGWTLGSPAISRETNTGVPEYAGEDTFVLSDGQKLVPVDERTTDDGTTVVRYRPRTEGEFPRIERHLSPRTDHWELQDTDGTVRRFGTPGRRGADPAAVADPDDRTRVFSWRLSETEDTFGNRIEYEYRRDSGDTDDHYWDQLYLDRVSYVDYDDGPRTRFLVTVDFEYEPRPDPFSRHKPGFEVRTTQRCASIAIRSHADESRPIRAYDLTYRDDHPDRETPANGLSQLAAVEVVGHADGETERLPPVEFTYSTFDPTGRDFETLAGPLPRRSLSAPELELADVDGDGLPDLVEIDDTIRYWRNLGDGEFDHPREMDAGPSGLSLADPEVQLLDADGDGRVDLVSFHDDLAGYFPLSHDGEWAEERFQPYDALPSVSLDDPEVKRIDLDGDGVTDAVRAGESLECFFQDREDGWTETRTVAKESFDDVASISFADDRVDLADMTGDGLLDVVFVDAGHVSYWPNQGHGEWGRRVVMRGGPDLPRDFDPDRVLVGDVDGDGASDVVYVENGTVTVWLNRAGNEWNDPVVIRGTPGVTDLDSVRLVDVKGRGIDGLLYSGDARDGADETYLLEFIDGAKPYLMTETRNNMGSATRLEYATSTEYYLADEAAGDPWETTLPSPRWVVASVTVEDGIAGSQRHTTFDYHHGYWDGAEREFRGFGRVDRRDAGSFAEYEAGAADPDSWQSADRERFSPPKLTRTWFHLGPVGPEHGDWRELTFEDEYWAPDPRLVERPDATEALLAALDRRVARDAVRTLRGKKLREEVYAEDGSDRADRPYEVTEYAYGLRQELAPGEVIDAPGNGPRPRGVVFPHRVATRETSWERGTDPKTQLSFQRDYDDYGQHRLSMSIACPRGWEPGTETGEYLATVERRRFADPVEGDRPVDAVAQHAEYEVVDDGARTVAEFRAAVEADEVALDVVDLTRRYYDGAAYDGRDLGDVGPHGVTSRTEQLVLTDDILDRAYAVDGTGERDLPADTTIGPYLTDDDPDWPEEYPDPFRESIPDRGGFAVSRDLPDRVGADVGYFAVTERRYDFQSGSVGTDRGLPIAERNGLGSESAVEAYDDYALNPVAVENQSGLVTTASYDYQAMKVRQVTDPNGNRSRNGYTPLGKVAWTAQLGTAGEREGDTPERPTVRYEYDYHSFAESDPDDVRPTWVHTVRRKRHGADVIAAAERERGDLSDADIAALFEDELDAHPERFTQTREYSDGFGRVIQKRTRADAAVYSTADGDGQSLSVAADDPGPVTAEDVADGAVRVVVDGWETYDNKGNRVESYDPFFDTGWAFLSRAEAARDRPETFANVTDHYYDPLGREVRTVGPDGEESRTVRGELDDVRDPESVDPSPWVAHTYDAVDNAGRTHPAEASAYDHRVNTPTTERFDALGNTVETVRRNRESDPGSDVTEVVTRTEYDIRGNELAVRDELDRVVYAAVYDLSGTMLRCEDVESGTRVVVADAADNELERRDASGALELKLYDDENRPTHHWARDDGDGDTTLRQRVLRCPVAGELDRSAARRRNLLGNPFREYDEAGKLTLDAYDFRDNPTAKTRSPLADDEVAGGPVDWSTGAGETLSGRESDLLSGRSYRVSLAYNAREQVTVRRYPADVNGDRKELRMRYSGVGNLVGIDLLSDLDSDDPDRESIVETVGYDARGRRSFVAYGNDVMARYAYDDTTHRLRRLRTEEYTATGEHTTVAAAVADGGQIVDPTGRTYTPAGTVLDDRYYEYDVGGNVTECRHESPGAGVTDGPGRTRRDRLVRSFTYDALGRLTEATGREGGPAAGAATGDRERYGYDDAPGGRPTVRPRNLADDAVFYTREYSYDPAGNMTRLHHEQGPGGTATWTRHFGYAEHRPVDWAPTPGSRPTTATGGETAPNRLTNVGTSETVGRTHGYDPCGNLRSEGNSTYRWDFTDRLKGYEETASGQTSVTAGYAYNADGTRVKKVVDKGDRREVSVYVDGIFEHHRLETAGSDDTVSENNELHVKAQDGRVAVRRVGTPFDDDRSFADGPRPATEYHLPDHLGNSSIVTDASGGWINREEYTPFGETALGGYERKRYRYGGKERDEESGLYYHGARYYAPWLCRWTTTDPAGHQDGLNRYLYVSNDPIRYSDPNGTQRENNATDGSSSGSSGDTSGGSGGGGQSNGGGSGSGGGGGQSEEGKQRKQNAYIIRLSEDDFLIVSKKEAQGVSQAYGIPGDLSEHLPSDIYAAHVEKTDEGLRIKQRFVYSPGKDGTDGQFVPLQRALTRARFGEMHEEMTGGARSHEARRPRPVVRRKVKGPDGRYRYKALSPKELKKYRRKKLRTLANSYWACIAYAVEDRWLGGSSDNKTNESMELLTMKVYESAQGVFESGVEGKHMQQTQRYATPGNTGGVENAQRKFKEFTRKNREKGSDILTQRGGRKAGDSTSNEPFNASTVKSRDRQDPDNPEEALDMVIDELKQMENN